MNGQVPAPNGAHGSYDKLCSEAKAALLEIAGALYKAKADLFQGMGLPRERWEAQFVSCLERGLIRIKIDDADEDSLKFRVFLWDGADYGDPAGFTPDQWVNFRSVLGSGAKRG